MLVFYLAAIDSDENKNKFEYIYHKYYRFMLRTASSIIRDSALAEDAVHETFVQLLKEIDSLRIDNEKSLQSYLYILTRERTIDFLRKWERRRGVLTDYENRSTSFDNFKEPEEIALTNLQLNKAVSILSDMPCGSLRFGRKTYCGRFIPRFCGATRRPTHARIRPRSPCRPAGKSSYKGRLLDLGGGSPPMRRRPATRRG